MKSAFLCFCIAVTLSGGVRADDMNMKNFSSFVLSANKSIYKTDSTLQRGSRMLGWRLVDRNNQAIGKVENIQIDSATGELVALVARPEKSGFQKDFLFDTKAQNIKTEDQLFMSDMDRGTVYKYQEQYDPAKDLTPYKLGPQQKQPPVWLKSLIGAPLMLKEQSIGSVAEVLGPVNKMGLDRLVLSLKTERRVVVVPLAAMLVRNSSGAISVEIKPEHYKIAVQSAY